MMSKVNSIDELINLFLYVNEDDKICVGVKNDIDLSDYFTPLFKQRLRIILNGNFKKYILKEV